MITVQNFKTGGKTRSQPLCVRIHGIMGYSLIDLYVTHTLDALDLCIIGNDHLPIMWWCAFP